ncbi:MAG: trypsin-like peptidase domain-containing protein [Ktedonobacteraceae bacterium]|nr:trypsin-like peptidase domain-containing protein [Ktedonobacteraceae bacterium]
MLYPDVNNNESSVPYQPVPQSTAPVDSVSHWSEDQTMPPTDKIPPYQQSQPTPPDKRPPSRGLRTGAIIALTVLLAVVFGTGLFAGWQFGHGSSATVASPPVNSSSQLQTGSNPQPTVPALSDNNLEAVREAVVAKVKPTVVQINVTTAQGSALGSGVIIDKRGYIVTNNHVVNGAQTIQVVMADGTKYVGQVSGTDPADDLAVVKINPPANMPVIKLGDSSQLKVGQDVLAIGNPLGITQTVTNGIVSALNRTVSEGQGGANLPDAIQTDAPINPGNSGGALVDLQGNLIGIPTLTAIDPEFNAPASGVGFAIPSNRVNFVVPQIIQSGKVTHTGRAALGISAVPVDQSVQFQDNLSVDHGVLISGLVNGGGAQKAGLQVGDVIVQVNNQDVTDTSTLTAALLTKSPGETVAVKVYRSNQQMTVNVTLSELQAG